MTEYDSTIKLRAECELAVSKLYDSLKKEFPDIKMLSSHEAMRSEGYTSILFQTEQDLSELEGSIQWICRSPYRPDHKRKNGFVDVSVIPEAQEICREQEEKQKQTNSAGTMKSFLVLIL